jgi:bacteriorhodopsin
MATTNPRRRLPTAKAANAPSASKSTSSGGGVAFSKEAMRKSSAVSDVSVVSDWQQPSRAGSRARFSVTDLAVRASLPIVDNIFRPLGLVKPVNAGEYLEMITIKDMHKRGGIMLAIWAMGLLILTGMSDSSKTAAVYEKYPSLPVLYACTAAAFAFTVSLDLMALYGAVTHEKRILSGLMAYVDIIACLSYVVLAIVPTGFAEDTANGYPVWFLRSLEWCTTCPTILFWLCLVTRAKQDTMHKMMALDAGFVIGGALSSCMWAVPQVILFLFNMAAFAYVMWAVYDITFQAAKGKMPMSPALPAKALNMIRWEIVIFWSLFPLVEVFRRSGSISYETGEFINCLADYAAKSGLMLIAVSCNLEQANAMKLREMEKVLGGMLSLFKKQELPPELRKQANKMGGEVSGWLMQQFANGAGTDSKKDDARSEKRKLNRALAKVDPDLVAASDLFSWDFDALNKTEEELVAIVLRVFDELKMVAAFGLSRSHLRTFVLSVRANYRENPFHNWRHAVTVLHTTYLLVTELLLDSATDLEVLAILLAALSHDLDHDGVNNAYHCNSQSDLALTFNDQSVLENHHCRVGFQLLRKSKLLQPLEEEDKKLLRKIFIQAILATDMVHHSSKMEELKRVNEMGGFGDLAEKDAERVLVLTLVLHTADLYNPIKPHSVNHKWAGLLQKEFNGQVQREEKEGLPSLPFMKGADELSLAKGEIGFISFVIAPWYEQLVACFPKLRHLKSRVESNLETWKRIAESGPSAIPQGRPETVVEEEDTDTKPAKGTGDDDDWV